MQDASRGVKSAPEFSGSNLYATQQTRNPHAKEFLLMIQPTINENSYQLL